jgi:hypothetical protein
VSKDDDMPLEERTPCQECGSRSRVIEGAGAMTVHLSASADAILVRAWDGNSLTLFGVLYGIVVTVVGVVIAKASTVGLIVYSLTGASGDPPSLLRPAHYLTDEIADRVGQARPAVALRAPVPKEQLNRLPTKTHVSTPFVWSRPGSRGGDYAVSWSGSAVLGSARPGRTAEDASQPDVRRLRCGFLAGGGAAATQRHLRPRQVLVHSDFPLGAGTATAVGSGSRCPVRWSPGSPSTADAPIGSARRSPRVWAARVVGSAAANFRPRTASSVTAGGGSGRSHARSMAARSSWTPRSRRRRRARLSTRCSGSHMPARAACTVALAAAPAQVHQSSSPLGSRTTTVR